MKEKDKEFWDKDMTTMHDRRTWFGALSGTRKAAYLFTLLFVVIWCFFIGFTVVCAMQPSGDQLHYITSADYEEEVSINEVAELTGTKVILLVGCDNRDGESVARSDTIMLLFLNNDTGDISLLSIPRDSYVNIAGTSTNTKINHAFYSGGIKLTKATVEQLTGISIDNYAIIDFNGFKEAIDAIGGVEIYVDSRMYKPSEGIDLYEGEQVLNGAQALAYCRYRGYSNADFGRIEHQQNFIKTLAEQMLSSATISSIPDLVKIAYKYVETDMKMTDAIDIGKFMLSMDYDNIQTYHFEGVCMYLKEYSQWLSYVILQEDEVVSILSEIVGGAFDFTPYVIDDNGNGRYSVPSNEEPPVEDGPEETPDVEDPSTIVPPEDPGIQDPGSEIPEPDPGSDTDPSVTDPNTDPGLVDPGVQDPGSSGENSDVWDIPAPTE